VNVRDLKPGKDPAFWRVAYRCGPNALYVYLRLRGHAVAYDDVLNSLPIGEYGTTLADLQRVAGEHGVRSAVIRATPETLASLLPAVVHTEEKSRVTGHYSVVVGMSKDEVVMIDGTTASTTVVPLSEFTKDWSGYALVPDRGFPPWIRSIGEIVAAVVLGGAAYFGILRLWRPSPEALASTREQTVPKSDLEPTLGRTI
jgi:hypothetical protein